MPTEIEINQNEYPSVKKEKRLTKSPKNFSDTTSDDILYYSSDSNQDEGYLSDDLEIENLKEPTLNPLSLRDESKLNQPQERKKKSRLEVLKSLNPFKNKKRPVAMELGNNQNPLDSAFSEEENNAKFQDLSKEVSSSIHPNQAVFHPTSSQVISNSRQR